MDILIKDFANEMPQTCYECPLALSSMSTILGDKFYKGYYSCALTHKTITSTRRSRFCPLVEVEKTDEK